MKLHKLLDPTFPFMHLDKIFLLDLLYFVSLPDKHPNIQTAKDQRCSDVMICSFEHVDSNMQYPHRGLFSFINTLNEKLSNVLANVIGFLPDYMNQNGVSDVMNPIYQHPAPPRTILPTISSDDAETEYLNCFRNEADRPEYLNEIPSPAILPLTSNGTVHSIQKYQPQNSIDNPDYQQDFTPTFKTHTNGHIPAAENAEYLGPDWGLSGYRHYIWDCFLFH